MSVPSFATNWKHLTTSYSGVGYIDMDSINYHKGYADVWCKLYDKNGAMDIFLIRITTDKRAALLQSIQYNRYGDVINSYDYSNNLSYSRIVPESVGESVYIAVYYS